MIINYKIDPTIDLLKYPSFFFFFFFFLFRVIHLTLNTQVLCDRVINGSWLQYWLGSLEASSIYIHIKFYIEELVKFLFRSYYYKKVRAWPCHFTLPFIIIIERERERFNKKEISWFLSQVCSQTFSTWVFWVISFFKISLYIHSLNKLIYR